MQMWIIGPDSYPHSPLQDSFSPRSSNIVEIGYRVNCRHCYVGSISMKDFTLARRDFEIQFEQMWIIGPDSYPHSSLQASFSPRSSHIVENRLRVNCRHCYVGSISMKDFTLPRRDFGIKLCKCGLLALILIRTVIFKTVFLQDQAISLKSAPSQW